MLRSRRLPPALPFLATIVAACGGSTDSGPVRGAPGLTFISQASVLVDTVDRVLPGAFTVTVFGDDSRPATGTVVRFEVRGAASGVAHPCASEGACAAAGGGAAASRDVTVDAQGQATTHVRLGETAGTAWLVAEVASLGYRDSVTLVTRPGTAMQVIAQMSDTLITTGQRTSFIAGAADRHGNVHPDIPVTVTADSDVETNLVARTIRVLGTGHRTVSVSRAGGGTPAQVRFAAVPYGRVAFTYQGIGIAAMELNGDAFRSYGPFQSHGTAGLAPAWAPAGTALYFHLEPEANGVSRIHLLEEATSATRAVNTGMTNVVLTERWPAPGGGYVWISGALQPNSSVLLRMAPDGQSAQQPAFTPAYRSYARPHVSRDGRFIAAVVSSDTETGIVRIYDLATRAAVGPEIRSAAGARWSPDGQWLALAGPGHAPLRVVRPDGTGMRTISARAYHEYVDWTADGEWLVASSQLTGGMELIRVSTGEVIPLPRGTEGWQPAVR